MKRAVFAAAPLFLVPLLHAQNGTWINTATSSTWSTPGNWSGGTIANGSGNTANFTTGFTANNTVTLDTSRSIGQIIKDDTNGALNTFVIASSGGSILTLATGGAATITNSDLGGGGRMDITAQISSTQGLTKLGVGNVHLNNNATSWAGNTTVSAGLLHLTGANLANIGGGTGRNISVAAGTAFGSNNISNAGLNRIVETAAEISILTSTGTQALDFTSTINGANLSGAFLGSNLTNGGKTEIQGIITMANNYRLGAVDGYQNGTFGIMQASLLSGTNGLIVGGNRVVIVGTHTFTGDTTLRDGARLGLSGLDADGAGLQNNSRALQNSVLDLGAPSSTGLIFLENGNAGGIAGLTSSANGGTTSATFGGLKGSRDLNSAFLFTGPGNNTSAKVATAITGFTLNVGTGVTATYSGAIGGFGTGAVGTTGGASTLTKTGAGTQILGGTSTYTGATNVNQGTLIVNGSISTSTLTTVAANATIGGSGTVGALTVAADGTVAPGNSPGILIVNGAYTQMGLYEAEIEGVTPGNGASFHDQIVVNGTVDITGGSLDTLFSTFTPVNDDLIFILLNDGSDAITGTFNGFAQGAVVDTYNGFDWTISYIANNTGVGTGTFTGGNDIALLAVSAAGVIPEPSTALLGALGALLLFRRRR